MPALILPPDEMPQRIRDHDWAATPLGPVSGWPRSLRAVVDMLLAHGFAMVALWGPELVQIYNDEYRVIMGDRHPAGLGTPTRQVWPEVWHINAPIYERVRAGETLTFADALYPIARDGVLQDAWFTLTYSPLRDDADALAGVLVTVVETTARVRAEQAQRANEERQAFLLRLGDAIRDRTDPIAIQEAALSILGDTLGAGRVGYAVDAGDGEHVRLTRDWTDGLPSIVGTYRYADYGEELEAAIREGRPCARPDIQADPRITAAEKAAHAALGLGATLNVPLVKGGRPVAILAVHYAAPHHFTADEIAMVEETAERTWAAVERAEAEAALRESEARFRAFVTASSDVVYRMNPDWSAMWQLEGRDFLADTTEPSEIWLQRYIVPEDWTFISAAIRQAIASRSVFELEHRVIRANGSIGWTFSRAIPLLSADGGIVEWMGAASDVTEQRRVAEEARRHDAAAREQAILVEELQHRTRNLLTVVGAVADRTLAASATLGDFGASFEQRLAALGRAQGLLSRGVVPSVTVAELVALELGAHAIGVDGHKVRATGPDLLLPQDSVQLLALALHELSTNAVKHGAVRHGGGLEVTWTPIDAGRLEVVWVEHGVPAAPDEPAEGFGRQLIEFILPYELDARTSLTFGNDGIRCTIILDMAEP